MKTIGFTSTHQLDSFIENSDLRAENIYISEKGNCLLGGLRLSQMLIVDGKKKLSTFSACGENFEWAAPEVICQVLIHLGATSYF